MVPDVDGTELPDVGETKKQAVEMAGEIILSDLDGDFWKSGAVDPDFEFYIDPDVEGGPVLHSEVGRRRGKHDPAGVHSPFRGE